MLPIDGVLGRSFAVLGLGRTGKSVCLALQASGAKVCAWDDSRSAREQAGELGIQLVNLSGSVAWSGISSLIVSPGVCHHHPDPNQVVLSALWYGVPLDNDIGLFFRTVRSSSKLAAGESPQVVAVTGSNGKSTTSALIHHVLTHSGKKSQLAGNIGRGVMDIDPPDPGGVVVLEVSSFQSELASVLEPDFAVFLNFSPDHYDRHGGAGGYLAAKRRLFSGICLKKAIIGVDEFEGRLLAGQIASRIGEKGVARISAFSDPTPAKTSVSMAGEMLLERKGDIKSTSIQMSEMATLPGTHNHQNACAAFAVCRQLGLSSDQIRSGFLTYPGLQHRNQLVGRFNGVTCVNDSKATNAESAARTLRAYQSIRWIAGGKAKQGGIAAIAPALDCVVKAYLIGDAAGEFSNQVGSIPFTICGEMETAVNLAAKESREGDTILLAPAAASFDQYKDFEERGNHFIAEVKRYFAKNA